MLFWILLGCAYVFGAIPFGLIIGKMKGVDIRTIGSGNIGATNVQRTLGWMPAFFSFLLDFAKGAVPVILALVFGFDKWQAAAIGAAVVIGHCWSVFLMFRGGKGISTTFAVVMALDWRIGLGLLIVWLIIILLYRYVSLASIIGASIMPFGFLIVTFDLPLFGIMVIIGSIAVLRHLENMKRLADGTENKVGQKALPNAASN
jgi:acyl phosphate:glycerol-3-phosphate acyltransferase